MSLEIAVQKRLGTFSLDAHFVAPPGLTVLFGRSGAGKTSIVNMIGGLLRPDRGRIALDGRVLFDAATRVDAPPRARRIGCVFQEGNLFPHLSVRQNLLYGRWFTPARERYVRPDQVIALLGIEHLLARRPGRLSGGEKQRVAIGRALIASPRLLLMDEPLASLDAERKAEILPYVERLRDELHLPIVYVSHNIEEVVRLATTLILLSEGRAVASGTVEEVMGRLDLHPATGRYEAGAVLQTRVADHDERYGLSALEFPGGRLLVPRVWQPVGSPLRVRIRARDVALALQRPVDISIRNVLSGVVAEVLDDGGVFAEVRVDVGGVAVHARITRLTLDELKLVPGVPVHALVKSIAIDRHSMGLSGTAPPAPGAAENAE